MNVLVREDYSQIVELVIVPMGNLPISMRYTPLKAVVKHKMRKRR